MRKSQPRIKGIKRDHTVSALHPDIRSAIEDIAFREKRSASWVIAEFLGMIAGCDAATGEKQPKMKLRRTPGRKRR